MHTRYITLFIICVTLAWGAPAYAEMIYSQTDDSAYSTKPEINIIPVVGYIPTQDMTITGLRFRVNASGGGDYICPWGSVYQYNGTSTPVAFDNWIIKGTIIGNIFPSATSTPDANGNCDYITEDVIGEPSPISFSRLNYYIFFIAAGGTYDKWVSMNGKPYSSTTPQSYFGYRPAHSNFYTWGTSGLDVPYFELFGTTTPPPPDDPCVATDSCVSNVLFLPGIEGSRLYEGTGCGKNAEEKLWEPYEGFWSALRGAGDDKVRDLFLNQDGTSICDDVYAKENDIIDSVGGSNIYKSFIDEMDKMKTDEIANHWDWKPIAYDWRLSLDDLLNNGAERDGKIYFTEATSTPYIEQTLRALAASSKTGKVTIVAHSNGGLVAKALLNKLENQNGGSAAKLIDKVIMVGAPQSGTPVDIGALLYGLGQGISSWGIPILHSDVAQELAENSPMAYHLIPSQNYFNSVATDTNHPVARFADDGYAKEISAYGTTITNSTELSDFLRASSLNSGLIDYANNQHSTLDFWTPPTGIEVHQIAGWGADTVAGIDFYTPVLADALTAFESPRAYRPILTEDGDGTVTVPSALMMASSTSVKKYWVNLGEINNVPGASIKYNHKNIFEISSLEDFIKNIIKNSTSTLPAYISTTQPAPLTSDKKLTFFLHSPLTLQLTDSSGNVTGLATDDSITENIPGSTYGEFGEVKYITVPEGIQYQLTMHGQANGTFSLDTQETTGGIITASSTIAGVPVTTSTTVTMNVQSDISTLSPMQIDKNGDGTIDAVITPKLGGTVIFDTTPPEAQIIFSPSTKKILFFGSDETSATTLNTSATSTTIADAAGNTLTFKISQNILRPNNVSLTIPSFAYSTGTTTNAVTSLRYFWRTDKKNKYTLFISAIRTPTERLVSLYIPAINKTYILQSLPTDDTSDLSTMTLKLLLRKITKQVSGMVIPYVTTKKGSLIIGY